MKKLKLLLLSCVFTFVMIGNVFASVSVSDIKSLHDKIQSNLDAKVIKAKDLSSNVFKESVEEDKCSVEINIAYKQGAIETTLEFFEDSIDSDYELDYSCVYTPENSNIKYYAEVDSETVSFLQDSEDEDSVKSQLDYINKAISEDSIKNTGVDNSELTRITSGMKNEVKNIADGMRAENGGGINPDFNTGAQFMNTKGASVKFYINLGFSIFLWFLWVAFFGFELLNGAIILFPVVRDKVTGDGATIPWYITHNTAERLKNMEEEPMKKWLTGEISRIITFFLISVGIFSGLIMWVVSALLNLIP